MKPEARTGLSIFSRLLIVFLSVNIITGVSLIYIGYSFSSSSIENRAKETIEQQIDSISRRFDQDFRVNLKRSIARLLDSTLLDDHLFASRAEKLITSKRLEHLFTQTANEFPSYQGVNFINADGVIEVNVAGKVRQSNMRNISLLDEETDYTSSPSRTVATRLFKNISVIPLLLSSGNMEWFMPPREIQIEGPYLDANGQLVAMAGMAKLDLDTGEFGGVVFISVKLNEFFSFLREVRLYEDNPVWVYDSSGNVLQQPENITESFDPMAHLPEGFQSTTQLVSAEQGLVAYRDFSVVPGKPFIRMVLSVPSSLLLKDLATTGRFFSMMLVASLIIVLLVSYLVSRYLSRPIVQLVNAATRLAKGDLNTRVEISTTGEVQALVSSFNQMTADLRNSMHARDESVRSLELEVSERKKAESELKSQARALVDARVAAEAAAKAKSEFLATMSHEIRTPINGVLGMTELLLHMDLTPKQHRFASAARSSGESLLSIINDILDFSKIEAGKLELQEMPFDLRNLIEDLGQLLAEGAQSKGLELICSLPPTQHCNFYGDAGRLRQVLTNLLGNAIKFTESGEVVVRVITEREDPEYMALRFEVSDTGIGIDEDAKQRVFGAFSQADASTTRRYGGTGLGLAISKQLVALLGGDLGVDSEPGRGSTFWFTTRLRKQRNTGPVADTQCLSKVPVLVVDDNASNREIMGNLFDCWDMHHREASDSDEAITLLHHAASQGQPFEIVLLDMNMPGMDGIELAKQISIDPSLSSPRLMMLSSLGANDEAGRVEAGIEMHLAKPIRQAELRDCLIKLLSGSGSLNDAISEPGKQSHEVKTLKGRILVAEDNVVNQQMALGCLELLGCEATIVDNGAEALQALAQNTYHVVLMDCRMPVKDGLSATRELRRRERESDGSHTPVVALTANVLSTDRDTCFDAGMDDYMSKPFTLEQLREVLERWLNLEHNQLHLEHQGPVPCLDDDDEPIATADIAQLDIQALSQIRALHSGSNNNVLDQIIDLFDESSTELLEQMQIALKSGDLKAIEDAAHTLKTSGANVGAMTLSSMCRDLEVLCKESNEEPLNLAIHNLQLEYGKVTRALAMERTGTAA